MNADMLTLLIPHTFALFVATIVCSRMYFRYKRRQVNLSCIETIVREKGCLDVELIQQTLKDERDPKTDFRMGLVLLALTAAMTILYFLSEAEVGLLGIAAFPGLTGLAFLIVYYSRMSKTVDY